MAVRPPTRCTVCHAISKGSRCEQHARKPWEVPSANSRLLSGGARAKFRAAVLAAADHECAMCGGVATEADHIIEVSDGGSPTDPNNGQALCRSCHQFKTQQARRARAARRKAARM